jgi:ligand-binding sensor domain-containing protein
VIKVDGANRKWIGTQSSGVYLMSEDGTEEIEHFTTENSPLFSNTIFDIVIDPKTGEVFFATEKGLLSYKGTATDADTDFNNVFVYPNPVKPDFTGTIGIRGLVKDTDVRITDISGNIVYQTTSFGGQAVWDGKDFNGNKVQTGVYMIFNGSPQGELKAVAKILFIH